MVRTIINHLHRPLILLLLFIPSLGISASAPTTTARALHLTDYDGKVYYVDFWASWCGPCRASFPFMNTMHKKYVDAGLTIIGVNVDVEHSEAQRFLAKIPADFAIHYDATGISATEFGVEGMPHSFIFDQHGNLLTQHKGFREDDKTEIEASIRAALGLEPAVNISSKRAMIEASKGL